MSWIQKRNPDWGSWYYPGEVKKMSNPTSLDDWEQGRGPRYGLTIVVANHCERANTSTNDILGGMTRVEGARLYNPRGDDQTRKAHSPTIQARGKASLDKGLVARLNLGSSLTIMCTRSLGSSRSSAYIILVMFVLRSRMATPYKPRRCLSATRRRRTWRNLGEDPRPHYSKVWRPMLVTCYPNQMGHPKRKKLSS